MICMLLSQVNLPRYKVLSSDSSFWWMGAILDKLDTANIERLIKFNSLY